MAMRKAIIASSLSLQGINGAKIDDCMLVADTPSEFSKEIIGLLKNHHYRRKLGIAARQFVLDHYGWKSRSEILEQTYRDAIDEFKR